MQLDNDEGPTIEAFKELSLQRDRRAEIRGGRGMPRGKAQGLRGLATGGRAGMAKRNLAGLAPDFVQKPPAGPSPGPSKPMSKLSALAARSSAKRPAENPPPNAGSRPRPASPASTSSPGGAVAAASPSAAASSPAPTSTSATGAGRPSKLAALAAARSSANATARETASKPVATPSQEPKDAAAPAKPLSKLQQRMLANRQQRDAATPEAKEAAAAAAAVEEARSRPQTCYGSSLPISSLFPTADLALEAKSPSVASGASLAPVSVIAGSSKDATDQLVAPLSRVRTVPGGSPFALYVQGSIESSTPEIELVKKAFAGPSPDDVVMAAREGTRLGAK